MPFSFTFTLLPPGLTNPFSALKLAAPPKNLLDSSTALKPLPPVQRLSPSPSSPLPMSRKRGWEPSFSERSQSTTTVTPVTSYRDTPLKYRDTSGTPELIGHEHVDMQAEQPPAKKRRTLAGSIVSTALSAALIGTAVGLTVYRLWRNRDKEPEQIAPPPPYQEGEWIPIPQPTPSVQICPVTPRTRKPRNVHSSGGGKRTAAVHHRGLRSRGSLPSQPLLGSPTRHQFSSSFIEQPDEPSNVEDQMDWIGDKLSILIEQGKKALGTEVVVMSEAQEDEVDDGTGTWEEEMTRATSSQSSTGPHRQAKTPRITALPSSFYPYSPPPLSSSPTMRTARFEMSSGLPITPPRTTQGVSTDSDTQTISSHREDESAWQSPELRESMGRARARFLQNWQS